MVYTYVYFTRNRRIVIKFSYIKSRFILKFLYFVVIYIKIYVDSLCYVTLRDIPLVGMK